MPMGIATFTTTSLPVGSDSITASYAGDPNDTASTSEAITVTIAASLIVTNTALAASAASIGPGQSVTFTATVSPLTGSNVPTGTVTFFDGTTSLGTAPLNAIRGVATFSTTTLALGNHSITATYGGDSKDAGSTSAAVSVSVAVAPLATTTALTASATQVTAGQSVTFTATVSPQSGTNVATGTVTFLDGTTSLGTAPLNATGVATFTTTTLATGSNSITASYGGDTNDSPSTSTAVTVSVAAAATPSYTMAVGRTPPLNLTAGQALESDHHIDPREWLRHADQSGLFRDAHGRYLHLYSSRRHAQRYGAGHEHGEHPGNQSSRVRAQSCCARGAGRKTCLRLGHALGIHFVVRAGKGEEAVAGFRMVIPRSGRCLPHRRLNVGLSVAAAGPPHPVGAGLELGLGSTAPTSTTFTLTIISTAPGTQAQNVQITVNVQS